MKKLIMLTFVTFVFLTKPAFAYLDPATGTAILQTLIAALAAVLAFTSNLWKRTKDFCLKITSSIKKKISNKN